MTTHDTPRVYLACLACYNEGTHNGRWEDANDADTLVEAIEFIQTNCGHVDNDWAIHDFEGFGPVNIGENPNLVDLAALARNIEEHGEAFAIYVSHVGADWDDVSGFEDAYCGEWDSERAYAENLADDIGLFSSQSCRCCGTQTDTSTIENYFDWDAWTRDLFLTDNYMVDGHVFRNL